MKIKYCIMVNRMIEHARLLIWMRLVSRMVDGPQLVTQIDDELGHGLCRVADMVSERHKGIATDGTDI